MAGAHPVACFSPPHLPTDGLMTPGLIPLPRPCLRVPISVGTGLPLPEEPAPGVDLLPGEVLSGVRRPALSLVEVSSLSSTWHYISEFDLSDLRVTACNAPVLECTTLHQSQGWRVGQDGCAEGTRGEMLPGPSPTLTRAACFPFRSTSMPTLRPSSWTRCLPSEPCSTAPSPTSSSGRLRPTWKVGTCVAPHPWQATIFAVTKWPQPEVWRERGLVFLSTLGQEAFEFHGAVILGRSLRSPVTSSEEKKASGCSCGKGF